MKCNFVTSAKKKKARIDGLRRYVTVTAEEQTALEDANLVLDYEETDVSTENEIKEGVTDGLNQFLDPKYSENSKVGESCVLCGFASSATRKSDFFSSMKRHMKRKHGKGEEKILKSSLSKPTESFKRMC